MKKNLILINGPARSGKDTIAKLLFNTLRCAKIEKFAKPLKEATKAIFSLTDSQWKIFDEEEKDSPNELFFNKTPRQLQILLSEEFLIKFFGQQCLCKLLYERIKTSKSKTFIISDFGFAREIDFFKDKLHEFNIIVIKVNREGFTYENDSRGNVFIDETIFRCYNIFNNSEKKHLEDSIKELIEKEKL